YAYDGAGRLRRVMWQSGDSVVYRYTVAGDLDTMRVFWRTSGAPRSESWRFTWDGLGRRRIIHYPYNQMTVQYSYDRLGTLRRVLSSNPGSSFSSDRFDFTMRQESVDVLGRPLSQSIQCTGNPGVAWPCGDWLPNNTSNRYNRLGALVIQERIAANAAIDTMRYDQSGNQIQRRPAFGSTVTEFLYPAASNRLAIRRDSVVGSPGHSDRTYWYDAAGNRIKQGKPFEVDTVVWQYDGLSRLVGSASAKTGEPAFLQFNTCRWDAAWRLAQPCGNGGQLALMGLNVTRSSLGWFFVHAPGIDEALLLIDRSQTYFVNKRLQAVTDGRGQLLAIADSAGFITEEYAGSGHDQSSWQGAGLTTQAQTFDPRKWQTNDQWGGIQQFRNRAYDPATGTWIQEDPMGVAGGVNVYRFNNGNPVSFGDPLGLMGCQGIRDCLVSLAKMEGRGFLAGLDLSRTGASEDEGGAGFIAGRIAAVAGATGATARAATTATRGASSLAEAGMAADRGGLTKAGRALAKHGGREGSVFSRPTGNPAAINRQGQAALEDILGSVNKTTENKFGGKDVFGGSRGGGARFDAEGRFIGFLEP
ncbi:MAG: RHS repeat-associated core domain-containing protein, partial [Gemmatimonadales bacterium]|nr:RHS repeat-associated core domain-containing protein [Gemmatimonadales bacterium]MDZ4390437.1 RHS repeat-associated core domain-containing protein [Gemmatimonadales bacterium]